MPTYRYRCDKCGKKFERNGRTVMLRIAIMVLALLDTGCMAVAAEPLEDPTNILAAQLRDQGYECNRPKSAERDVQASKPDEQVWIVQCENAKYRMRLDPDMAATVERIN
jgi:hypothetical protein